MTAPKIVSKHYFKTEHFHKLMATHLRLRSPLGEHELPPGDAALHIERLLVETFDMWGSPNLLTADGVVVTVAKGGKKPNGKLAKKDIWRIEFPDGTHTKWMNGKQAVRLHRKMDKLRKEHMAKVTNVENEV